MSGWVMDLTSLWQRVCTESYGKYGVWLHHDSLFLTKWRNCGNIKFFQYQKIGKYGEKLFKDDKNRHGFPGKTCDYISSKCLEYKPHGSCFYGIIIVSFNQTTIQRGHISEQFMYLFFANKKFLLWNTVLRFLYAYFSKVFFVCLITIKQNLREEMRAGRGHVVQKTSLACIFPTST